MLQADSQIASQSGTLNDVPDSREPAYRTFLFVGLSARLPAGLLAGAAILAAAVVQVPQAYAAQNPVTAQLQTSVSRISVGEDVVVELTVDIAEGWHINSNAPTQEFLIPTEVSFELPPGLSIVELDYPEPIEKSLRFGGAKILSLFEGKTRVTARLRYDKLAQAGAEPKLLFNYQACNDTLCLPPQSVRLPLRLKLALIQVDSVAYAGVNEEAADSIAALLASGWWAVIPALIFAGLVLNATPCVYPLVSVTLAYFGSQAGQNKTRKLSLALAYAAGIVVTFSAFGVVASLSGSFFGSALGNPIVNVSLALVMFALALSSFGVYHLRLSSGMLTRLGAGFRGVPGALFMGMTMGLVAAPCVGPFVVGMLLVVGTRGDAMLGMQLFSLLGVGLGLPYVILAVAAGSISKLPRSGDWLQWVEHLFGVILLGMGLYFLGPVLPEWIENVLMPLFMLGAIGYLAFLDPHGTTSRRFVVARVIIGVLALAAVAVQYLPSDHPERSLAFQTFSGDTFLAAKRSGAPFVVEFGAEWCLPCKEMKERTFTDAYVVGLSEGFTFLSVDMTTSTDDLARILRSFEVLGAPTTLFYGPHGEEVTRRIGFVGPEEFAELLKQSREGPARDAGTESTQS